LRAAHAIVLDLGGVRLEVTEEQAEQLRRQLEVPEAGAVSGAGGQQEVLTPEEAAPLMRHSAKSVRGLCRLPRDDPRYLRHLRKGREILIWRSHIDEWIARQIGDDD
jgi:hypothetical protein